MAKKRKSNKWIIYLIVILGVIVAFLLIARGAGWIGQDKGIEVELSKVEKMSITEKVSASGMVQPVIEVNLSPEVSGEIITLSVEEGDSVAVGQELATIRPDNFESALEQTQASLNQQRANLLSSKASLARAKATFQRSELEFNRQKKLHDEAVISDSEWELAKQNYAVAKNDLESAEQAVDAASYIVKSSQASVSQAQENLRRTTVTAPMSGVVSKLNVEEGETVLGTQQFQGTEIMRIADLDKMEVRVDVNENDIIRVAEGDTAIIDVDSYSHLDKEFKGVVTAIANTANEKVSTDAVTEFEVRIRILNSSYQDLVDQGNRFPFRPGMTASVDIITTQKNNILAVPLSAVTTRNPNQKPPTAGEDNAAQNGNTTVKNKDEDKEVVFVNENGKAKMRVVKTGISDYNHIEIVDGLKDGEEVVSGPFLVVSKRLNDNMDIYSKETDKKPEEKKTTPEAEAKTGE